MEDKKGFFNLKFGVQELVFIVVIIFTFGKLSSDFDTVRASVKQKADKELVQVWIKEIKTSIDNVEEYVRLLVRNEIKNKEK